MASQGKSLAASAGASSEEEDQFLGMEDPAAAWINLVEAYALRDLNAARECINKAKSSKWTVTLWNKAVAPEYEAIHGWQEETESE